MKQSFLFANLIFILYLFTSCGSSKTIAGDATSYVTPIICAEEYSQKIQYAVRLHEASLQRFINCTEIAG